MTDRDTKFLGFAKLLYDEISWIADDPRLSESGRQILDESIKLLIAQRAYDLVAHTLHEVGVDEDVPFNDATTPQDIPDLTQWPTKDELR